MPPAILTGWVDRIMRPGVAYEFLENDSGDKVPNGLLRAQKAIVFNTSNTKTEREIQIFLDPLETMFAARDTGTAQNRKIAGAGYGIHWPGIDEDPLVHKAFYRVPLLPNPVSLFPILDLNVAAPFPL